METFVTNLRRLPLVIVCILALLNGCGEDDTITGIHEDCTVSFEVTEWITDELCWLDCLERYPVSSGEVNEADASGIVVPILLSHPASDNGYFQISWKESQYGKAFTTIPAPSADGFIEFTIANGDLSSSFRVLPIDNSEYTNGLLIRFNIGNVTGSLHEGVSMEYMLTIKDDEN